MDTNTSNNIQITNEGLYNSHIYHNTHNTNNHNNLNTNHNNNNTNNNHISNNNNNNNNNHNHNNHNHNDEDLEPEDLFPPFTEIQIDEIEQFRKNLKKWNDEHKIEIIDKTLKIKKFYQKKQTCPYYKCLKQFGNLQNLK